VPESFRHALDGLREAFHSQRNIRLQCAIGFLLLIVSSLLQLPFFEFALILALISLVLCAELMNTAVEGLLDQQVGAVFHPAVRRIKDLAAASVLVVCVGASALGAAVLLPHVRSLVPGPGLPIPSLVQTGVRALFLGACAVWWCQWRRQTPETRAARASATVLATSAVLLAFVVVCSR
jgi:diacylglycerol kinase